MFLFFKFIFDSVFLTGYNTGCTSDHRYQQTINTERCLSDGINLLKSLKMSAYKWHDLLHQQDLLVDVPIKATHTAAIR